VSIQSSMLLAPGMHAFSAQQVDAAGNPGATSGETTAMFLNALASSDYDGDGLTDLATYRPASKLFTLVQSSTPDAVRFQFIGTANQIPVPADYDGDG